MKKLFCILILLTSFALVGCILQKQPTDKTTQEQIKPSFTFDVPEGFEKLGEEGGDNFSIITEGRNWPPAGNGDHGASPDMDVYLDKRNLDKGAYAGVELTLVKTLKVDGKDAYMYQYEFFEQETLLVFVPLDNYFLYIGKVDKSNEDALIYLIDSFKFVE